MAERLNVAGYAVYTLDHEGHGKSGGTKGNIVAMSGVLDDFDHLRRTAHDQYPDLPLVVLGHSMGGLIALDYLVSKGQDGVTAAAPSRGRRWTPRRPAASSSSSRRSSASWPPTSAC